MKLRRAEDSLNQEQMTQPDSLGVATSRGG
ncbi:hypothetical protein E2C01_031050 [Portunus trituberculatus]|uniref:Uncharacterized protein n=1 Tax=Portunus trituberculatus TaxID=210409 RepID=A0A5B7EZ15_PORTR|nr:hypothetical protein [Portunus trituberculatus]